MAKTSKPSLAKTHPKIAAEALGWNPFQKNWSSRAQVRWQCPEGHHYSESIVERVKNGKDCGECVIEGSRINKLQKKKVLKGRWTKSDPKIAKQADGWDPTKIKSDSLLVKNWKCKRKHHFKATVSQARKQNGRCCKCIKWSPKEIKLRVLAIQLSLDHDAVIELVKKDFSTKLHGNSKLNPSTADKIVDILFDETGKPRCKRRSNSSTVTKNYDKHETVYHPINERCSSCGAMFDTQRSHECRNY
jgi:hypothetical protein